MILIFFLKSFKHDSLIRRKIVNRTIINGLISRVTGKQKCIYGIKEIKKTNILIKFF